MKAVVATFNEEKALVGAFSVITNLRMDLRFKLYNVMYPGSGSGSMMMGDCRKNCAATVISRSLLIEN